MSQTSSSPRSKSIKFKILKINLLNLLNFSALDLFVRSTQSSVSKHASRVVAEQSTGEHADVELLTNRRRSVPKTRLQCHGRTWIGSSVSIVNVGRRCCASRLDHRVLRPGVWQPMATRRDQFGRRGSRVSLTGSLPTRSTLHLVGRGLFACARPWRVHRSSGHGPRQLPHPTRARYRRELPRSMWRVQQRIL